jgi:hypothetical protein
MYIYMRVCVCDFFIYGYVKLALKGTDTKATKEIDW